MDDTSSTDDDSSVEKQLGIYWVLLLLYKYRHTNDLQRMGELRAVSLSENEAQARILLNHLPCNT